MMHDGLTVHRKAPPGRHSSCRDGVEQHLPDAAVMLAYAFHLFTTIPQLTQVEVYPDGEHAKRFEMAAWLRTQGFILTEPIGLTGYCGRYTDGSRSVVVSSLPGQGDVVARTPNGTILAECKGGVLNSKHAGQSSRLRRGLCEALGLLMTKPREGRQIAVVPHTDTTLRLALKMASRASQAGIEIALVDEFGQVTDIHPQ